MNKPRTTRPSVLAILRQSISTISSNPVILYPLFILTFIQLLFLELLYFYPRFPLSTIFGPIIARLWGDGYMHYPYNFVLLPQLFSLSQRFIYIIFGVFLNAVMIEMIFAVNNDRKTSWGLALRKSAWSYVHVFILGFISMCSLILFSKAYGLLIARALKIRSETGILAILKKTIVLGAPYAELFMGIVLTTLLAFVIPIIIIERKKIFAALLENFRLVFVSFFPLLILVLLPTILYSLILLLRSPLLGQMSQSIPSYHTLVLVLSILLTVIIDATVLTATTLYYLHKKENS